MCCVCLVAQLCPTLCNPKDCSLPSSSVHGDSPGKNTGVDCHALLQGIFPTQGSNAGLLHCRQILYHLCHRRNPLYQQSLHFPHLHGILFFSSASFSLTHVKKHKSLIPGSWIFLLNQPNIHNEAHIYYSGRNMRQISSVQSFNCVWLFAAPWTAARPASLSIINSQSLLKLMSIELVMPSNWLILCRPLLLPPSIFPRVFSNESVLPIRWPKHWNFSFSISPSYEYSGLISFRMDWLDLLAVQGTLKSLLQHHSSKTSIPWHSAFFIVQLSHPYMITGKPLLWRDWPLLTK